nr:MAG: hypothetical protein BECKMB1821G_GA0114241_105213 [Candidatus Kentron sp. MB]
MLRGLANRYGDFTSISGLTNKNFTSAKPVRIRFFSVKKAHRFQYVANTVFGKCIEVKR